MTKLTNRDKVGLIIIAIIVIFAAGYFLGIKPKMAAISTNKDNMASLEAKRDDIDRQLIEGKNIETNIKKKYEEGKVSASVFFSQMQSFNADKYIQGLIDASGISLDSIEITPVDVTTLNYYTYAPISVIYPSIDQANLNVDEKTDTSTSDGKTPATTTPANGTATTAKDGKDKTTGEIVGYCQITLSGSGAEAAAEALLDKIYQSDKKSMLVTSFKQKKEKDEKAPGGEKITQDVVLTMYYMEPLSEPQL